MSYYQNEIDRANKEIKQVEAELKHAKGKKKRALKKRRRQLILHRWKMSRDLKKHLKQEEKTERKENKEETKQIKASGKWSAFNTAYANGIDPRKGAMQGVAGIISSAGTAGTQVIGAVSGLKAVSKMNPDNIKQPEISKNNTLIIGLVGLAAIFLMKGNSRG